MSEPVDDLRFTVLRNAIYHSERRQFLDRMNRLMSLIVVMAGTAAVGDLGTLFGLSGSAKVMAAIAAFAATIQLVFDLPSKARTHEFLQRRFYELAAEIEESGQAAVEPDAVHRWNSLLNRMYAEEPPPMRALDAVAYNAALESLGRNKAGLIVLTAWQSISRQVLPFNGVYFPTLGDGPTNGTRRV